MFDSRFCWSVKFLGYFIFDHEFEQAVWNKGDLTLPVLVFNFFQLTWDDSSDDRRLTEVDDEVWRWADDVWEWLSGVSVEDAVGTVWRATFRHKVGGFRGIGWRLTGWSDVFSFEERHAGALVVLVQQASRQITTDKNNYELSD